MTPLNQEEGAESFELVTRDGLWKWMGRAFAVISAIFFLIAVLAARGWQ